MSAAAGAEGRAIELHRNAIVFDAHVDLLHRLIASGQRDIGSRPEGHVDIPRLGRSGLTGGLFALYSSDAEAEDPVRRAFRMAGIARELCRRHPEHLLLGRTAEDVRRAKLLGKVAVLLSIENGNAIGGSPELLLCFRDLGVRVFGLVWNGRNELGRGCGTSDGEPGLTPLGREVVRSSAELGMAVDVSHLDAAGVDQVLSLARAPVLATHSNARAICAHRRNLSDEHVRGIAATGGVVGVNVYPPFVRDDGQATIEHVVDHVAHLVSVAGAEHVGLGCDYDGISAAATGLEDVACLPRLTAAMIERGLPAPTVRAVLGSNLLRVLDSLDARAVPGA